MLENFSPLSASLLAGFVISLMAFVGFGALLLARKWLSRTLLAVVAFAAGSLLGAAFFHLLPESIETGGPTFFMVVAGLVSFFLMDSLLWIYHCHAGHQLHDKDARGTCPPIKTVGTLNLVGDAIHNIMDGIVVGSAFLVSLPLGLVTTIAVALHEIPQELSDFGVLLYSGYKEKRALLWNFLVALTILVGISLVYVAQSFVQHLTQYTIPFAAGGFIYIACTNLLSEIKEEESVGKRFIQFILFLFGIVLLWLAKEWLG